MYICSMINFVCLQCWSVCLAVRGLKWDICFVCLCCVCLDRDPGAVGKLLGEAGGRFGGGVQCSCSR